MKSNMRKCRGIISGIANVTHRGTSLKLLSFTAQVHTASSTTAVWEPHSLSEYTADERLAEVHPWA
jgi:lambda repressor-like predicted transcriptional regulator